MKTLEELIKECGSSFAELSKGNSSVDHPWTANGYPIALDFCGNGSTPKAAVRRLLEKINKK